MKVLKVEITDSTMDKIYYAIPVIEREAKAVTEICTLDDYKYRPVYPGLTTVIPFCYYVNDNNITPAAHVFITRVKPQSKSEFEYKYSNLDWNAILKELDKPLAQVSRRQEPNGLHHCRRCRPYYGAFPDAVIPHVAGSHLGSHRHSRRLAPDQLQKTVGVPIYHQSRFLDGHCGYFWCSGVWHSGRFADRRLLGLAGALIFVQDPDHGRAGQGAWRNGLPQLRALSRG